MQTLADILIKAIFGVEPQGWFWTGICYLIVIVLFCLVLLVFAALFAGITSWVERRIAARMMSRVGPNRVGPQGFLQWLADGLKLFLKEDLIPTGADRPLYRMAPYFVFAGMFGTFVALPFGAHLVAADLNVGIYYLLAVTAFVVIGIIMGGWSSNNKWALFGGIRSAAQMVSYEIPAGLAVLVVVLLTGGLSTQEIIKAQGGWPWDWFIFHSPFTVATFFVFITSALAEGNRTPFDLPEAESELVAGYATEYSGFRFVVFFFAEWANLWVMSAIMVLLFLGGWRIPGVSVAATSSTWWLIVLSFVVFCAKTLAMVFFVIHIRWTLPRLRVDQMMKMCWTYLVPAALVCILGTMVWMGIAGWESIAGRAMRGLMFLIAAFVAIRWLARVRYTYMSDRDLYHRMDGRHLWYPPWKLP
jgi:NADH-quinone oxidoreductase subunit H